MAFIVKWNGKLVTLEEALKLLDGVEIETLTDEGAMEVLKIQSMLDQVKKTQDIQKKIH